MTPIPFLLLALLTDHTVTTTADGGPGSLRDAVDQSNASPGADTVLLPAGTYALDLGSLTISDTAGLTVAGDGADVTTVDAQGLFTTFRIDPGVTATFTGLHVTGGLSQASFDGGNLHVDGHLVLEDCEVTNGTATFGGGVRVSGSAGSVVARRCTFTGNQGFGSAIESQQGAITVSNCTLSGNSGGGGVIRLSNASTMNVRNSTVVDNGSGLVLAGGASAGVLFSSIVWNNAGGDTSATGFGWGTWSDGGYNLIGDANGTVFPEVTNRFAVDPRLGALTDNGGSTRTRVPRVDSPVREAGANADGLTSDQRGPGFPRVAGAHADIGAVEGRRALQRAGTPGGTVEGTEP